MVWRQRTCVTNYVDQQTLNPDDHYVLPHQRLWTFDVLVCPLSVTERFLFQPLVCGTVFHRTSLMPPLSPSSAVVLNHISSHFLILLSDSSLICPVPAQWLVILETIIAVIFNIFDIYIHKERCFDIPLLFLSAYLFGYSFISHF